MLDQQEIPQRFRFPSMAKLRILHPHHPKRASTTPTRLPASQCILRTHQPMTTHHRATKMRLDKIFRQLTGIEGHTSPLLCPRARREFQTKRDDERALSLDSGWGTSRPRIDSAAAWEW